MKKLYTLLVLSMLLLTTAGYSQDFCLYVSDAGNFNNPPWQIVKFDANGENPEIFIDENLGWPQDIVFLEDDNTVLVSNLNTGTITRYNALTGSYIDDFATGIAGPTRMKIGDDDLLYVLEWGTNGIVKRYQLDGTFVDEFTTLGISQSIGMDWDAAGNFYVSSFGLAKVQKFDANGNDQGVFIDTNLSGPTNILIEDGVMYVLDWNAGVVQRFDAVTGAFIDTFISGLTNPEGVDRLPNGNFLIGDNGSNSVKEFDSNGNFISDYTVGGGLLTPNACILRDVTLSVEENEINTILVVPTIGDTFSFNTVATTQFQNLEVYNSIGKLVDTISLTNNTTWNASGMAEGLYFLVGEASGTKTTQKIIVKKK